MCVFGLERLKAFQGDKHEKRKLPVRPYLPLRPMPMQDAEITTGGGCSPSSAFTYMPGGRLNTLLEHRSRFLGFVQRRVPDAATAEDILQAAYMRALEHEGELQAQESVVGWFYRVLRNAVIDRYRRRASENKALEAWSREMEGQVEPSRETNSEVCACIVRVLEEIRPDYAGLLRAVDLGGQRLQEFAREHRITASNAGVRAHRARAALRRRLIEVCGICSEHACVECTCRMR
jgi:RNA polymerase sigma factor (sigma-70 family)